MLLFKLSDNLAEDSITYVNGILFLGCQWCSFGQYINVIILIPFKNLMILSLLQLNIYDDHIFKIIHLKRLNLPF